MSQSFIVGGGNGLHQSESRKSLVRSPSAFRNESSLNKSIIKDKEIHKIYGGNSNERDSYLRSPLKKNNFEKQEFRIS